MLPAAVLEGSAPGGVLGVATVAGDRRVTGPTKGQPLHENLHHLTAQARIDELRRAADDARRTAAARSALRARRARRLRLVRRLRLLRRLYA